MGVALTHGPKTIHAIDVAALVAGHNPGRYIQCTHQQHKRRGDVFAETRFAVKPELICRVGTKNPGLQCVGVAACA